MLPSLTTETHPETLIIRDQVIQAMDLDDLDMVKRLLSVLETKIGFGNSDINRQFILSQKAKVFLKQGKPPMEICPLLNEGLSLTFNDFDENNLEGKILLFEESEILHSKR